MLNFCTLFNSAYLSRGIVLYNSLIETKCNFHLYIFAFDEVCFDYIKKLKLDHATVISLVEFEDIELKSIKSTRTAQEYCWTCTPSTIRYVLKTFSVENCTYIDADMYFFETPQILIDEIPNKYSVLITEHRYTPKYDQSNFSGKYCVQFMYFKNNADSLKVLENWRNDCLKWCYAKTEDGKFGDQKYLDLWKSDYPNIVWELRHLGGGVAPWNIQQYNFEINNNKINLIEKSSRKKYPLIFYHYHGLKFYYFLGTKFISHYRITKEQVNMIYKNYEKKLNYEKNKILMTTKNIAIHHESELYECLKNNFINVIYKVKSKIKKTINQ